MTLAAGQQIQANDYNILSNSLATVWGQGTGNKGWGQSVSAITNVTTSNQVTAAQWTGLIQATNSALSHLGQPTVGVSNVTAGTKITYLASLTDGVYTVNNSVSGTTGVARTDSSAYNASYSGAWGNSGNRGVQFTHTITFSSGDAARYFFNAGGRLALSFARSGGTATVRNTEWSTLCTAAGQWHYSSLNALQVGGGVVDYTTNGTATVSASTGYWNTGTSASQQMILYDGYAEYSTNYIVMYATLSGTAANGGRPTITLQTFWINAYSNTWQQEVDGTATTSLIMKFPSTTYLSASWGSPTITATASIY